MFGSGLDASGRTDGKTENFADRYGKAMSEKRIFNSTAGNFKSSFSMTARRSYRRSFRRKDSSR